MTETPTTPPADVTPPPTNTAPTPGASTTPTNAAEANAQMRTHMSDRGWVERFLSGNSPEVREFNELSAQIVSAGDEAAGVTNFVTTTNALTDPLAVSPAAYEGLIGGLRSQGLPDESEQAIREIDLGLRTDRPSQGDGVACRQALDRLIKTADWRQRLLSGEPRANNLMGALSRIIAYSTADGAPVSQYIREKLSELGLR